MDSAVPSEELPAVVRFAVLFDSVVVRPPETPTTRCVVLNRRSAGSEFCVITDFGVVSVLDESTFYTRRRAIPAGAAQVPSALKVNEVLVPSPSIWSGPAPGGRFSPR